MTKEEWKSLKKERGMKIYVQKFYGNYSLEGLKEKWGIEV